MSPHRPLPPFGVRPSSAHPFGAQPSGVLASVVLSSVVLLMVGGLAFALWPAGEGAGPERSPEASPTQAASHRGLEGIAGGSAAGVPQPGGPTLVEAQRSALGPEPSAPRGSAENEPASDDPECTEFVSGRVMSADGAAIEGALLSCSLVREALAGDTRRPPAARTGATDAQGEFRLGPFPPGRLRLDVRHPGCTAFARLYDTNSSGITIELAVAPAVFGVVLDSVQQEPAHVTHTLLEVSTGTAKGPWKPLTDWVPVAEDEGRHGRFRVPVPTRRFVRVLVRCQELAITATPPLRLDRPRPYGPIELRAQPGGRVRGVVADASGDPIDGAEVRVLPGPDAGSASKAARTVLASAHSRSDGTFITSGLQSGPYRIEVTHPQCVALEVSTVELTPDTAEIALDLTMHRGGSVRGSIASGPDDPGTAHWVSATRVDGPGAAGQSSGAQTPSWEGRFQFGALLPGTYQVQLMTGRPPECRVLATETVAVVAGEEVELELRLAP